MRFKKRPQLPGAGRIRAWHHHGSHTPTSPGAILLGKMVLVEWPITPNKSAGSVILLFVCNLEKIWLPWKKCLPNPLITLKNLKTDGTKILSVKYYLKWLITVPIKPNIL